MKQDIKDYVCSDLLMDDGVTIDDDENLLITGILDSLALMRLVMHLEDSYSLEIPPQDITLENFGSVTNIAGYLTNKLDTQAA